VTRVATVDIGTNSVLLLVAEVDGGGVRAISDHSTITRLGQGVDATSALADEAIARTSECLTTYAEIIAESGVDRVAAVATSAMRDAKGGDLFLDRAESILGTRPEIISGRREAELTFEGAVTGLPQLAAGRLAVFDVGGGSTEIIVGVPGDHIQASVSLDIGAVRLTERHLHEDPPAAAELQAVRADVVASLQASPDISGLPLVGVAGTVTTLGAISRELETYDAGVVHGQMLSADALDTLLTRLSTLDVASRKKLAGLDPRRADVIVAGAIIVDCVRAHARTQELIVSDRGVRYGLAKMLAS
jgi:exopolyphosphatase/guanosine-5'-triphosphate,3'-diphosphate pyrophosphatase